MFFRFGGDDQDGGQCTLRKRFRVQMSFRDATGPSVSVETVGIHVARSCDFHLAPHALGFARLEKESTRFYSRLCHGATGRDCIDNAGDKDKRDSTGD